jgi:thymidylate synthase (FAD)
MGTDLSVVNAARVSFDKESDWEEDEALGCINWPNCDVVGCHWSSYSLKTDDKKLIKYLAKHDHWTPFAHTSISLRMQAPVPIRTQCFKHKQGLVENEESRRYISSTPKLFVPDEFRMAPTNGAKQGSGGVHPQSEMWKIPYMAQCREAIGLYESMVRSNVCPEQARFVLPQGCEVQWIWTGNLYAFANFYNKRTDAHAQKEIQDLARMVGDIIQPLFPVSWKALTE